MSYTYETALAAPPDGRESLSPAAAQRVVTILEGAGPALSAVGSVLSGMLWGAIAAGKGNRGNGALWGGLANGVASPAWYYGRRYLGTVGSVVSLFGGIAVPSYAARYGTGQVDWPPTTLRSVLPFGAVKER